MGLAADIMAERMKRFKAGGNYFGEGRTPGFSDIGGTVTDGVKGGMEWAGEKNYEKMDENPYRGQWDELLAQLTRQSNGEGPSLAGNAYREANATGMRNIQSMSRGGSAGAARMGMQNMGRMQQGLQSGYSNARLQEQLAARQQLQAALVGAGNAWFQPQQANMNAANAAQSNGQMLTNFVSQAAGGFAPFMTQTPQAPQQPQQWVGPPGGGYPGY